MVNKKRKVTFTANKNNPNILGINKRRNQLKIKIRKVLKVHKDPKVYDKTIKSPEVPVVKLEKINQMHRIQDTEEETESSSDYADESSDDDSGGGSQSGASTRPGVDLDIGSTLRRILDQDYELIMHKNKVFLI